MLRQEENLGGPWPRQSQLIGNAEAIASPRRFVLDMDGTAMVPFYGKRGTGGSEGQAGR